MAQNYTIFFLGSGSRMLLDSETGMVHDGKGHNLYHYENGRLYALNGVGSMAVQPDGRIISREGTQIGYFNDYQGFLAQRRGKSSCAAAGSPASSGTSAKPASSATAARPASSGTAAKPASSGASAGAAGPTAQSGKKKKSHKGLLVVLAIILGFILLSENKSDQKTGSDARTQSTARTAVQVNLRRTAAPTATLPPRTQNDWLTPGNPYEHYILNGRDCGMNGRLKGRVNLICSFVDNSLSSWTDSSVSEMLSGVWKDASYLEQQASRYGVYLKITVSSDRLSVPRDQESRWLDYLLETRYRNPAHNLSEVGAYFASSGGYDQCCFLFYFNTPGRCVCYSAKRPNSTTVNEYAMFYPTTMDSERSAAHELYHLFGAVDYYIPARVKTAAEKYFPNASMLIGRREMDELTAYLIGWTDSYSASALSFMKEVADVTRAEADAALSVELGK